MSTVGCDAQPEHTDRRDIDNIRRRVVSIEKIRRELRWSPSVTIEEGLRRTHQWLSNDGVNLSGNDSQPVRLRQAQSNELVVSDDTKS